MSVALSAKHYAWAKMPKEAMSDHLDRRFGRIINTSIAVKLPQAELGLSHAVRAGLTGFVSGITRDPAHQERESRSIRVSFRLCIICDAIA